MIPGESSFLRGGGTYCSHGFAGLGSHGCQCLGLTQGLAILCGQFWARTPTAACSCTPVAQPRPWGSASPPLTWRTPPTKSLSSSHLQGMTGVWSMGRGLGLLVKISPGTTVCILLRATRDHPCADREHTSASCVISPEAPSQPSRALKNVPSPQRSLSLGVQLFSVFCSCETTKEAKRETIDTASGRLYPWGKHS